MKLNNTSTIVTGGAGGLGEAVVRAVVAAGGHAVIADLADAKGEALAVELGDAVRYVRTDVLDDDTVQGASAAAGVAATVATAAPFAEPAALAAARGRRPL